MTLHPEQREQLLREGYLCIDNVVPRAHCEAVIAAMCEFVGVDIEDAATWPNCQAQGHGIVPIHHHQALWDVRQLPQLHNIFATLYETERLWVTLDRVSFKLPTGLRTEPFRMDKAHWDGDPRQIAPFMLQGLVYLTDTPAQQGAFAMAPSMYKTLADWLSAGRSDAEVARPDLAGHPLVTVPGKQGTLVIWHRHMPHTSTPNNGTRPRLVQYVSMNTAPIVDDENNDLSKAKVDAAYTAQASACLQKRPPAWAIRQRVPGQQDPEPGPAVQFTALGRKLAGIDRW